MESKFDFLSSLPLEVRTIIYANLSPSSLASFFILSQQVHTEIKDCYKQLYGKTDKIVSDFLASIEMKAKEFYERPRVVECINSMTFNINSMTFKQFVRENYLQFATTDFQPIEIAQANNYFGEGLIYLEIKDNELFCWTINSFQQRLEVKIQSDRLEKAASSLEMVKPFEQEIREKLGEASVKAFLDNLGSGWIIAFLDKRFQDCYKNSQINHQALGSFNRKLMASPYYREPSSECAALGASKWHFMQNALDCITGSSLNLLDYACLLNDNLNQNIPVLDWLKKHPKELEVGYILKIKKLRIIKNEAYFSLIRQGVVTVDECLKFGEKLFILKRLPASRHSFLQADRRIVIESFCEGLGEDKSQFVKGKAVEELITYIIKRYEEYEKEKNEPSFFNAASNFFKKLNSKDNYSKVNAAIILVHVLLRRPGYCLLARHIAVLTKDLGSESEDRLTRIVRTMVLEPLKLKSIDALNPPDANETYYPECDNDIQDESYLFPLSRSLK